MTSDLKLRISLALFVSIFLAVSIYMQHRENAVTDGSSYSNPYFPIISGYLFPALVLVMFVILLVKSDIQTAFEQTTLLLEHTHPLETPSGMIGFEADEAILDFSHTLVSDFTVTVEAWDGSQNYTISGSSLETPMVLPLADYPARYMICGKFLGYNGVVYDAEFRFDFGEMDE